MWHFFGEDGGFAPNLQSTVDLPHGGLLNMTTCEASPHYTIRNAILTHLLSALEETHVDETPFSHFYLDNAFPESIYTQMLENLPDSQAYRPGRIDKHMREDGVVTKGIFALDGQVLHHLPKTQQELWGAVADALSSVELKRTVFKMLSVDLSRRFRKCFERVDEIIAYPKSSLIRNLDEYEIRPHPDGSSKIVTMQFYLPRDLTQLGLGTALYERHLFRLKTLFSPQSRFEKVKQFPFRPNSGYGFAVSRRSFHGREAIPTGSGARNSLLHIYYDTPDKSAS